jgi:hypothetical protein
VANFADGRTHKRISLQLVNVPIRGTLSLALWGGYELGGVPLTVSSSDSSVVSVAKATDRSDYRMFTLRGLDLGETTIIATASNGATWDSVTAFVHMPRARPFPRYDDLASHYAGDEESSEDFRARIGGAVDNDDFANTCTLRLSEAFNGAGQTVPSSSAGLLTVLGGDKRHYAIRVAEFKRFLTNRYGPADIVRRPPAAQKFGVPRDAFYHRRGVICFEVPFGDATGHFTLWDGNASVHGDYFDRAVRVSLWMAG